MMQVYLGGFTALIALGLFMVSGPRDDAPVPPDRMAAALQGDPVTQQELPAGTGPSDTTRN